MKENDINQIISIITWFKQVDPTHLDELYDKMIKIRNQFILDRLKKFTQN
jgi:hypothetical protein